MRYQQKCEMLVVWHWNIQGITSYFFFLLTFCHNHALVSISASERSIETFQLSLHSHRPTWPPFFGFTQSSYCLPLPDSSARCLLYLAAAVKKSRGSRKMSQWENQQCVLTRKRTSKTTNVDVECLFFPAIFYPLEFSSSDHFLDILLAFCKTGCHSYSIVPLLGSL